MTINKKDNWKGASPALIDAINHINNLLKEHGVNAECDNIYIQYRVFDGFALNIVGERLDDETVAQCQLQFKDDYSDVNEYPHQYLAPRKEGEPYVTQLFVVENMQFYILKEGDDREKYVNDWIIAML